MIAAQSNLILLGLIIHSLIGTSLVLAVHADRAPEDSGIAQWKSGATIEATSYCRSFHGEPTVCEKDRPAYPVSEVGANFEHNPDEITPAPALLLNRQIHGERSATKGSNQSVASATQAIMMIH